MVAQRCIGNAMRRGIGMVGARCGTGNAAARWQVWYKRCDAALNEVEMAHDMSV